MEYMDLKIGVTWDRCIVMGNFVLAPLYILQPAHKDWKSIADNSSELLFLFIHCCFSSSLFDSNCSI